MLLAEWRRHAGVGFVGGRGRVVACVSGALVLVATPAQAGDEASATRAHATPAPACPTCPSCCQLAVDAGPRVGISINGDQWLLGGHLRIALPCLGNLGFGPVLAFGVGSNYLTLTSSGRLDYLVWFDDARVFGAYPVLGASALFYMPGGRFAAFCNRVGLDECWGHEIGWEVGGGLRYRWFGLEALAGFTGLPALTVMAAASFPLTRPGDP